MFLESCLSVLRVSLKQCVTTSCDRESTENLRYDGTSHDYMYTKCFSVETRDEFLTFKICKK